MHRITESSSIRFFVYAILGLVFAMFLSQRAHAAPPPPSKAQIEAQYEAIGTGFETMMLNNLYQQMRKSSTLVQMGDDNPFAPSNAEKIFRSMQEETLVQSLAKTGPLGVKKMVIERLQGRGGIEASRVVEYKNKGDLRARRAGDGTE